LQASNKKGKTLKKVKRLKDKNRKDKDSFFRTTLISLRQLGLIFLLIGLNGCVNRQFKEVSVEPIYLIVKTPKQKFSDQGFLKRREDGIILEIYKGLKPYRLALLGNRVCVNGKCTDRKRFLTELGMEGYPPTIFELILNQQPLPFLPSPIPISAAKNNKEKNREKGQKVGTVTGITNRELTKKTTVNLEKKDNKILSTNPKRDTERQKVKKQKSHLTDKGMTRKNINSSLFQQGFSQRDNRKQILYRVIKGVSTLFRDSSHHYIISIRYLNHRYLNR